MKKEYLHFALGALIFLGMSCASSHYKVSSISRSRILIDKRYDTNPDAEANAFITPYKLKVDSIMGPVIGKSAHFMDKYRPESELSNLLCDILVWAGKDFNEKPVFSVYNMGGIRAALAEGNVTIGDINEMAPFENKICFLTLSGEKTLELFQQIAMRGGEGVSHAVKMVITKDHKLVSATINGKPINPKDSYRIATLDYLAEGNDQLTAFKSGTDVLAPKQRENNVRYIIMNYFREQTALGKSVESHIEGRIVVE